MRAVAGKEKSNPNKCDVLNKHATTVELALAPWAERTTGDAETTPGAAADKGDWQKTSHTFNTLAAEHGTVSEATFTIARAREDVERSTQVGGSKASG